MQTIRKNCVVAGLVMVMRLANLFEPSALGQSGSPMIATTKPPVLFQKTLREFITMAGDDHALGALLAKHRLTLQYTLKDLDKQCYIGFDGEKVVGAFGQPSRPAELVFVSDAGTMDRLL